MTRRMNMHPPEPQLRAAYRILETVLNSENPVVQRTVAQALHDSKPSDALAFTRLAQAALLVSKLPVTPINARVHSFDPRD